MASAAYIRGALDTLVKSGEMSPAFAAGVADVLTKHAGILSSIGEDVSAAIKSYRKEHPGDWDSSKETMRITPEDAFKLIDEGRSMWTGLSRRAGDYWGNRLRKWTRWWPGGDSMTAADYDAELQDRRNRFMRDYIAQAREENAGLPPWLEAALQDKFVGDSSKGYLAAKHKLHPLELQTQYGKDEEAYSDKWRTASGTAAMRGKLYQDPKYDIKSVTPEPVPESFLDDSRIHMYGDQGRDELLRMKRRFRSGQY